ncbi:MAG: ATP-dependent Clp protease adaptor ClpS [Bacteroidales bacterium]|nr:ATP-dependent Clp protease adaptor ClpS [Candidatus Sodaliphilus fimicaballi]
MAQKDSQGGIMERTRLNIKVPRKYKVILVNDDFTPMDFVVMILTVVFHKTEPEAEALMLAVHNKGKAVVGLYTFDEATSRAVRATRMARNEGFPMRVKCEPE